jgi:hypothetical protein
VKLAAGFVTLKPQPGSGRDSHTVGSRLDSSSAAGHHPALELSHTETFRIKAVPGAGICTLVLSGEADIAFAPDIIELGVGSLDDPAQSL